MTRWIAVPVCPKCDQAMPPDEDGDYVCFGCDDYVPGEENG